jgi:vacuolar-type H+-ATPase subunit B/Vma2
MSDGLVLLTLIGAAALWLNERAWRKQVQRDRDQWMERALKEQRLVSETQEMNWQLLDKLKRATGARKDVN